jgi:hypothetical protein
LTSGANRLKSLTPRRTCFTSEVKSYVEHPLGRESRVETNAREPASFGLRAAGGFTEVSVQSGALEVRAFGSLRHLKAGESYTTAPDPLQRRNLSGRKRAGLFVALAAAAAVVAAIIAGRSEEVRTPDCESVPIVPSPGAGPPPSFASDPSATWSRPKTKTMTGA